MNRFKYIAAAGLSVLLAACGGGNPKPTPAPDLVASPKSTAQVVAPAPEAAASQPAANDPGPTTPAPAAASAPSAASEPAASEPIAAAPAPASTPVIIIDARGDGALMGITAESPSLTITQQNEPADLQAALQKQFQDLGISVNNDASGGAASSLGNELDGMDGLGAPLPQRLAASTAAIEIEQHGSADMFGGESISDYQGYLAQWLQAAKAAGKIAVLEEPGPQCGNVNPHLPAYVAAMDDFARTNNVPLIAQYQPILALSDWAAHMDASCQFPDAALDQFKAQQELAVIEPLVKTLIGEQK